MILLYVGLGIAIAIGAFILYLLIVAIVPGFEIPEQRLETTKKSTLGKDAERPGQKKDVRFQVNGTSLSAWLYLPQNLSAPVPCIIMGHGLGGTKDTGLHPFAERFQEAGFAVLAFDYRHLGESEGEPRQLVWIPYQLEDYSAAIAYARGLDQIDPARTALWGTSLSGGHVIVTAARDDGIACVSAQCPWLDGMAGGRQVLRREGLGRLLLMIRHGQRDLIRSYLRLPPHKIPLFGTAGSGALLADEGAWHTLGELAPDHFVNEVCARIIIRMDKYRPVKHSARVRCPVLLQVTDDEMSLQGSAIERMEKQLGNLAEIIHYPIGHFDVYLGSHFERSVSDQLAFFKKHL